MSTDQTRTRVRERLVDLSANSLSPIAPPLIAAVVLITIYSPWVGSIRTWEYDDHEAAVGNSSP